MADPMNPDAGASDPMVEKVLAALMATDAWKKIESVIDKLDQQSGAAAQPPGEMPVDAEFSPGAETVPGDGLGEEDPNTVAAGPPEKHEYAAGASSPTATNSFLPGATPMRKPAPRVPATLARTDNEARAKLARQEARLLQQEDIMVSQAARLAALEKENREAKRGRVFDGLVNDIEFDPVQEMADTIDLDDAAFDGHVKKMVARYKRSNRAASGAVRAAVQLSRTGNSATSTAADRDLSREENERVVQHAGKSGKTYADAKRDFLSGSTNGAVEKVS